MRSRCILSFTSPSPYRPVRKRERNAQVDRCLGQGSLELGDSSGAVFLLPYRDFQKYYYGTFPQVSVFSSQQAASGITRRNACTPTPPNGMHPQFPSLKLAKATGINFFDVVADTRITDQAHGRCGSFTAELMCTIAPGGATCGPLRKAIHADQKGSPLRI